MGMTLAELLRGVVAGSVTEAQFTENFFRLLRSRGSSDVEAECLDELVEDVNMSEHMGELFDKGFVWRCEECLRLLSEGRSASEIRRFFGTNTAP